MKKLYRSFRLMIFIIAPVLMNTVLVYAVDVPVKTDLLSHYKSTKAAVRFSHKVHGDQKVGCMTCHHKSKDGKAEVKCSECHQPDANENVPSFKDAFHKRCKGCHEQRSNTKAPTKCSQCHKG